MEINIKTKYWVSPEPIVVRKSRYMADQSIALMLTSNGAPVFTATVCLQGNTPPENHVWIKDWSENEGIRDELIRTGVIGPVVGQCQTGHATATLHELVADLYDESDQ